MDGVRDSQQPETLHPESLPHPGPLLILTVAMHSGGQVETRYHGTPEWAVEVLRDLADRIEQENNLL